MNATPIGVPDLLAGDVAIVTGGARGIGRAIAHALAASGAAVAIGDVHEREVATVAAEIVAQGGRCLSAVVDVGSLQACSEFVAQTETRFGPLSILVNNAGILRSESVDDAAFEAGWEACFRVNVDGTMHMTTASLAQLRRTRGCIVNLCSTSAFIASNRSAAYAATKAAVASLTRSLAVEFGRDGIRVNAVAPGVVRTGIGGDGPMPAALASQYQLRTPLGRMGEPHDIAGPVLFLASRLAAHMTGVVMPVDGGYLATGMIVG
jgi:NAD(P)-dependent dehydrogenase (short-subunit alcohol dehydrogenase family)